MEGRAGRKIVPGNYLPDKSEEEQHRILQLFEISLWLDTYDDIFSDFDPRPYSQRALSEDFLNEAMKASRDKPSGNIELKFLIPRKKQDRREEVTIKRRLREHFIKHHDLLNKKKNDLIIRQGILFVAAGIILMFIASLIIFYEGEKSLLVSFLIILLEPAGWFLFWEGLNFALFEPKKMKPDIDFYKKMSRSHILFVPF